MYTEQPLIQKLQKTIKTKTNNGQKNHYSERGDCRFGGLGETNSPPVLGNDALNVSVAENQTIVVQINATHSGDLSYWLVFVVHELSLFIGEILLDAVPKVN